MAGLHLLLLLAAAGGGGRCDVHDFGAVGDGRIEDSSAINAAIQTPRCHTVVLPAPGVFLTGTVRLRSHLTLSVQVGGPSARAAVNSKHGATWGDPPPSQVP